ncbi:hypothetical protein GCM10010211_00700 [Streptomyces albospinus]|uniref:Uncharacterized protein n=1 Tax=Streptomyces albospinus TaxID=285515 RepID=A0ABQ2UKD0_9ACTN|nr:hypothetical protein [Streptomyces albospinus]GGU41572.1 hypothetical protein GCM10010211_00700 [Streptomyces albospinus]
MSVSLIKHNPLQFAGRSLLEIAMESSHNLSERTFQLGRELDTTRRALAESRAMLDLYHEAGLGMAEEILDLFADLDEANMVIEILRDSLSETRRLRDERERVLRDELAHYKALADAN